MKMSYTDKDFEAAARSWLTLNLARHTDKLIASLAQEMRFACQNVVARQDQPFLDQINNVLAPVTRAYSEPTLLEAKIGPDDIIQEDSATVWVRLRLRRDGKALAIPGGRSTS